MNLTSIVRRDQMTSGPVCRATIGAGVLVILVTTLSLMSCASDRRASSPPAKTGVVRDSAVASATPGTAVTPEKIKSALAELDSLAKAMLKKSGIPGFAVAVTYKDQVVFAKGYGVREAGKPVPVDAETVFQLASISKPVGSTVIGWVSDGWSTGRSLINHPTWQYRSGFLYPWLRFAT